MLRYSASPFHWGPRWRCRLSAQRSTGAHRRHQQEGTSDHVNLRGHVPPSTELPSLNPRATTTSRRSTNFTNALDQLLRSHELLVVDVGETTFIDSLAIHALLHEKQDGRRAGNRLSPPATHGAERSTGARDSSNCSTLPRAAKRRSPSPQRARLPTPVVRALVMRSETRAASAADPLSRGRAWPAVAALASPEFTLIYIRSLASEKEERTLTFNPCRTTAAVVPGAGCPLGQRGSPSSSGALHQVSRGLRRAETSFARRRGRTASERLGWELTGPHPGLSPPSPGRSRASGRPPLPHKREPARAVLPGRSRAGSISLPLHPDRRVRARNFAQQGGSSCVCAACGDGLDVVDGLASLVDASLVVVDGPMRSRASRCSPWPSSPDAVRSGRPARARVAVWEAGIGRPLGKQTTRGGAVRRRRLLA